MSQKSNPIDIIDKSIPVLEKEKKKKEKIAFSYKQKDRQKEHEHELSYLSESSNTLKEDKKVSDKKDFDNVQEKELKNIVLGSNFLASNFSSFSSLFSNSSRCSSPLQFYMEMDKEVDYLA